MPSINSIINSHNHKVLRFNGTTKICKCRNKTICHFNGECLFKIVYKATIIKGNETKEYYGSTGVSLKKGTPNKNTVSNLTITHKPHYLNT